MNAAITATDADSDGLTVGAPRGMTTVDSYSALLSASTATQCASPMANQHHPDKQAVTYWLPRELVARLNTEAQRRTDTARHIDPEAPRTTQVDLVRVGIDLLLGDAPTGQVTVTDYDLYAPNGQWLRTATKVVLDGREICFTKKLDEREALHQARVSLEQMTKG